MIQLYYTISAPERLAARVQWVESLGRNAFGAPQCASRTAWFSGVVRIPMDALGPEVVRGRGGDLRGVERDIIAPLRATMAETGRFPQTPDGVAEGALSIDVVYDGSAWAASGDYRLGVARELGWRWVPVQITYFDGGERHAGALRPHALLLAQYHGQMPDDREE